MCQRLQPGLLLISGQGGICLNKFLCTTHIYSITHSQTCDWQTPIPQRHEHAAEHTHPCLCSHAASHISCCLLLLWQAVFRGSFLASIKKQKPARNKNKCCLFPQPFSPKAARLCSIKGESCFLTRKPLWIYRGASS